MSTYSSIRVIVHSSSTGARFPVEGYSREPVTKQMDFSTFRISFSKTLFAREPVPLRFQEDQAGDSIADLCCVRLCVAMYAKEYRLHLTRGPESAKLPILEKPRQIPGRKRFAIRTFQFLVLPHSSWNLALTSFIALKWDLTPTANPCIWLSWRSTARAFE